MTTHKLTRKHMQQMHTDADECMRMPTSSSENDLMRLKRSSNCCCSTLHSQLHSWIPLRHSCTMWRESAAWWFHRFKVGRKGKRSNRLVQSHENKRGCDPSLFVSDSQVAHSEGETETKRHTARERNKSLGLYGDICCFSTLSLWCVTCLSLWCKSKHRAFVNL